MTEAEIDLLQEAARNDGQETEEALQKLLKRVEELDEQKTELMEALKPFAKFNLVEEARARSRHTTLPDDMAFYTAEMVIDGETVNTEITVGDFRRARKAYKETK